MQNKTGLSPNSFAKSTGLNVNFLPFGNVTVFIATDEIIYPLHYSIS